MNAYKVLEGKCFVNDAKIGIVVARFNGFLVENLLDGALDVLRRSGVPQEQVTVARVPGAFELPLILKKMAESGEYDGLIALGAVIRGATTHYESVANECNKGIANVMLAHTLPIANAVLTTENIEQAIERSGTKAGNKGAEAAGVVVEMIDLIRQL